MKKRIGFDRYFADMALLASKRSTCLRRQVGAVVVKNRHVVATGYNGAPTGIPHCEESGCLREKLGVPSGQRHELCRGVHAEQNAIIQAAKHGVSLVGGTLYCTHHPCAICLKMIVNVEIAEVVYLYGYVDELASDIKPPALPVRRLD